MSTDFHTHQDCSFELLLVTTIQNRHRSSFFIVVSTVTLLARHPDVQAVIICFRIT